VNPFSTAVVFLAITANLTDAERQRQVFLACCYATGVLLVFLFGISMPALRLAGGLIVARVGFGMLS